MILLFKAVRRDAGGTGDLFDLIPTPVPVQAHVTKQGVFVPTHTATRNKRPVEVALPKVVTVFPKPAEEEPEEEPEFKVGASLYRFTDADGASGFEFEVPVRKLDGLKASIAEFSKKAKKVGANPPRLVLIGEPVLRQLKATSFNRDMEVFHADMTVPVQQVRIYADTVKIAGWSMVGALDHEHGVAGKPLVLEIGGTVPKAYRDHGPTCDHCKTKRQRNMTFLLRNEKGQEKLVGKTCLKDFTGHDPAAFVFQFEAMAWIQGIAESMAHIDDWDEEPSLGGHSEPESYFTPLSWAQRSAYLIRKFGFRRSSDERGGTWRDVVDTDFDAKARDEYRETVTLGDKETAEGTIAWLQSIPADTDNGFLYNARLSSLVPVMDRRTGAILTAAVHSYIKDREKAAAEKATPEGGEFFPKAPGERKHVGTPKKRESFDVRLIGVFEYNRSPYGYHDSDVGYLHKFVTRDGDLMLWFAGHRNFEVKRKGSDAGIYLPMPMGRTFRIAATPKSHEKDRKDKGPVTIVNRVTIDWDSLDDEGMNAADKQYAEQRAEKIGQASRWAVT